MKVTRRKLLSLAAKALAVFGVGGAVQLLLRDRPTRYPVVEDPYARAEGILRPPGALPEREFLAACIRCYRCQDACEPGAIQFYTEEDGYLYHTPYVDPAKAACTLCMKCGPACPTAALLPIEEHSEVAMGSVELIEDLCLSYKAKRIRDEQADLVAQGIAATEADAPLERRGPCGECFTVCPLRRRAIRLAPGRFLAPLVFPENCVGCGLCEEICRIVVRGDPAIRVVRTRAPVFPS